MRARNHSLNRRESGNTIIEFTLVGIPLIFVLISIFEMSRGMWMYETVAHAVRDGARYAAVHGATCATVPNSCAINVGTTVSGRKGIAQVIQDSGVGLDPALFTVTISSGLGPTPPTVVPADTLTNLLTSGTNFSSALGSASGDDVVIKGSYQFKSALAMFWPGGGTVKFAAVNFAATSRERIDF